MLPLHAKYRFYSIALPCAGGPVPEAESSFGAPSVDAAEVSTGRDVAMAGTAPADAELLDDADTETAAAAADRCCQSHPSMFFWNTMYWFSHCSIISQTQAQDLSSALTIFLSINKLMSCKVTHGTRDFVLDCTIQPAQRSIVPTNSTCFNLSIVTSGSFLQVGGTCAVFLSY